MIQNNSHGSYKVPTKGTKVSVKVAHRNSIIGQPVVSKMNGENHTRTGNTPLKGKRMHGTKMVKTSAGIAM
jgi:hypothetical protein